MVSGLIPGTPDTSEDSDFSISLDVSKSRAVFPVSVGTPEDGTVSLLSF